MRKFEDYVYGEKYNGILAQLVAENRSLLYLVPGNGNYAGNGARDAWIRWTAYAQAELEFVGEVPPNAEGEAQIIEWMREYYEKYPETDPFEMKPENRGDWAAFYHDIRSWGGILRDVANNLVFSYQSVLSFLESHDPFELMAAPFISFFGTASNVMTELVTAGGIAFDGFSAGFQSFFSGVQTAFQDLWQGDFFGAASSFFSGVGTAISNFINGIGDAILRFFPVVLDLDGDGIELLANEQAAGVRLFESDGIHYIEGGWVAPDDGVLAIDLNGNGRVDTMDEFVFTRLDPDAETDLEALAILDTNEDGILDAADDAFVDLLIWQDLNTNGACEDGEAISLIEAGIVSIDLSLANRVDQQVAGHDIVHLSTFMRADGTTGEVGDVVFNIPARLHSTQSELPGIDPFSIVPEPESIMG